MRMLRKFLFVDNFLGATIGSTLAIAVSLIPGGFILWELTQRQVGSALMAPI